MAEKKLYKIEIVESVSRTLIIDAESEEDAARLFMIGSGKQIKGIVDTKKSAITLMSDGEIVEAGEALGGEVFGDSDIPEREEADYYYWHAQNLRYIFPVRFTEAIDAWVSYIRHVLHPGMMALRIREADERKVLEEST